MNLKLLVTEISSGVEREITVRYDDNIDAALNAAVRRLYGRNCSFQPQHGLRGHGYAYGNVIRPTYTGRGELRELNGFDVGKRLHFSYNLG